jgi:hypothetical protein
MNKGLGSAMIRQLLSSEFIKQEDIVVVCFLPDKYECERDPKGTL